MPGFGHANGGQRYAPPARQQKQPRAYRAVEPHKASVGAHWRREKNVHPASVRNICSRGLVVFHGAVQ